MKEVNLSDLIKWLQESEKKGGKTAKIKGTIMVPETGNEIIISTERQM